MRKVALTAAFLSVSTMIAGCGDDYPSNVDANIIYIERDAGPQAEVGGGGGDAGCPSATFITPAPAAKLTAADDADDQCRANGFQIDVKLAVGAPDGTAVTLLANNTPVGTPGVVAGGTVTIKGVSLGTQGTSALVAQIGSGVGCSAMNNVNVDCTAVSCNITKPVISEAHPKLNDVPVAEGGDRVSSPGSDYQAAFEVMTNAPDNSVVQLQVRRADAPEATVNLNATVLGNKANFPGVTMRPDGQFQVQAVCRSGTVEGRSQLGTYTIDTGKPELTVTSPTMGQFFGPSDLVAGKYKVCASTSSSDAVGLGMATPRLGKNLGAGVGTSLEFAAVAAAGGGGGTGCVELACNGGAPFDLNVSLFDDAGNKTTKVVQGVKCASALPSVQVVAPTGDVAPYVDLSKRLLAASSSQPFKDLQPNVEGAQTDVVACTDKPGTGRLLVSLEGGTLNQIGAMVATVAATDADKCPSGLAFVVRWPNATLLESATEEGALTLPTQFRVELVEASSAVGASPLVKLWVDPTAPFIEPFMPIPLCGRVVDSLVDTQLGVTLRSNTKNVVLKVDSSGGQLSYDPVSTGTASVTFGPIVLKLGDNELSALASEASGNRTALISPCTVKVGQLPSVTLLSPSPIANLCAAGNSAPGCIADSDGVAAGWQGDVEAAVVIGGAPATTGTVTFKLGDQEIGVANIDGAGRAKLVGVTIPDGPSLRFTATTSDIAGTGVGLFARNLVVDTIPPAAVPAVTAVDFNRRETSFKLSWNAPADGTKSIVGYDVRVSRAAIDASNFSSAERVAFSGVPAPSTQLDGIVVPGRTIEKEYFFAVRAIDEVGNLSDLTSTTGITARFKSRVVDAPAISSATAQLSYSIDGVTDVNGDGKADLLVGPFAGQHAFIYFGVSDPSVLAEPSVVFEGPAASGFGASFIGIGDIDADGLGDIAISASSLGNGTVFIYKGRASWLSTYNYSDATEGRKPDYVIDPGTAYTQSGFGSTMARLGDVNGDGVDDFAIGASGFNGFRGRVMVVFGSAAFSTASMATAIIDGPDESFALFGGKLLGMGRFFTSQPGNSLVVAATNAGGGKGRVYAFPPLQPSATVYPLVGVVSFEGTTGYGSSLGLTGGSGGAPGLLVGSAAGGVVDVWTGTPGATPFLTSKRFTNSAAPSFGRIAFGSAFSGSTQATSLIGDSAWDFVAAGISEAGGPANVYVLDSNKLSLAQSTQDVKDPVLDAVVLPLPAGWIRSGVQQTGMIRDFNGDGFADLAIGEVNSNATLGSRRGRFVLYW